MGRSHKKGAVAAAPQTISASFRIDAPRWVWLDVLSTAPRPFSRALALLSLRLDVDSGEVKSMRDYARIWGWTKSTVGDRMPELWKEIEVWIAQKSAGQSPDNNRTAEAQSPDKSRGNSGEITETPDSKPAAAGQSSDSVRTVTITEPEPVKKEGDAQARACDWPAELAPIWDLLLEWRGEAPGADLRKTVQLLLMPKGHPAGCKLQREYPNRVFNGYTIDEVLDGIERWTMASHHSAAALVKHVANLIEPHAAKGGTNGTSRFGHSGKPLSSYEKRLGTTVSSVAANRAKLGFGGLGSTVIRGDGTLGPGEASPPALGPGPLDRPG